MSLKKILWLIIPLMILGIIPLSFATTVQDNTTTSLPSSASVGGAVGQGMRFNLTASQYNNCINGQNSPCILQTVGIDPANNANIWHLWNRSNGALLKNGTITSANISVGYAIYPNSLYAFSVNLTSGNQNLKYKTVSSLISGTNLNFQGRDDNGNLDTANIANILWLNTSGNGTASGATPSNTFTFYNTTDANTTYTYSTTPTFTINATNASAWNITLYVNTTTAGTAYNVNSTYIANTTWSAVLNTPLTIGREYQWWFTANSNATNAVNSSINNIFIAGTYPVLGMFVIQPQCSVYTVTNGYYIQ